MQLKVIPKKNSSIVMTFKQGVENNNIIHCEYVAIYQRLGIRDGCPSRALGAPLHTNILFLHMTVTKINSSFLYNEFCEESSVQPYET